MGADAAKKKVWTPEEYLDWERAAPEKHELFQGEVFAMAGAKRRHNLLVGNIVGELREALRHRRCEVYPSDMRSRSRLPGSTPTPT